MTGGDDAAGLSLKIWFRTEAFTSPKFLVRENRAGWKGPRQYFDYLRLYLAVSYINRLNLVNWALQQLLDFQKFSKYPPDAILIIVCMTSSASVCNLCYSRTKYIPKNSA